jgi:multidrug resistance efflux pump
VSDSFPRTVRALQTDGMNPTVIGLILITVLIAFWCYWLALGRVSVYEVSAAARLEAEHVHPVAAAVGGRIVASDLSLGRHVQSGDVLLEIEADREQLEAAQERMRLDSLGSQLASIANEIEAEEQAIALSSRAERVALSEASERLAAAEAGARQADDQYNRLRRLGEQGLVSEAEVVRALSQAEARRAEVAAARLGIERLGAQQIAAERERRGHLGSLLRARMTLQGDREAAAGAVTRHEWETEERRIRAPVDGRLGEISPVQVGAMIRPGERVASIVTKGPVKVVAEFHPSALGRVRAGQSARVRLDGFPWTQYGHIPAAVHRVGSETRDGRVRVELAVHQSASSSIPLEHGLPGAVEIEVERAAPVALLIRTLGYALMTGDARLKAEATPEPAGQ